jgi:ubiquinone/menaquinone biosynthesis C-methylase UbiE
MRRFTKLYVLLLTCLVLGWTQIAKEVNKDYYTPEGRARIAKSLEDHHRTDRLKPSEMIAALGIKSGSTVADVGTGVGMMLPYLSEAVGPAGRVIAQDIQQDFLDQAQARAKAQKLTNVTFVLGTERNPTLPERQVDLAFVLDAYHHFDYPEEMLGHISRALQPDGRLAIVDFYRHRPGPQDKDMSQHVRADKDEVVREIQSNGYELVSQSDHGSNQYVLIFKKKM